MIGSTGLGGADSALRLLLPMSSSPALLHSISMEAAIFLRILLKQDTALLSHVRVLVSPSQA